MYHTDLNSKFGIRTILSIQQLHGIKTAITSIVCMHYCIFIHDSFLNVFYLSKLIYRIQICNSIQAHGETQRDRLILYHRQLCTEFKRNPLETLTCTLFLARLNHYFYIIKVHISKGTNWLLTFCQKCTTCY